MLTVGPHETASYLICTRAASGLQWRQWDEIFIVYQPTSAETHVFNQTTAMILRCLAMGPLEATAIKAKTETALGLRVGELVTGDFEFATTRLEELGLIECLDEASIPR